MHHVQYYTVICSMSLFHALTLRTCSMPVLNALYSYVLYSWSMLTVYAHAHAHHQIRRLCSTVCLCSVPTLDAHAMLIVRAYP